jgi:hypothetical protein
MIGGRRITCAALALLASLLLASSASAQSRAPTAKDKEVAAELVKKAIAKSRARDYTAAIELYLEAYRIVPSSILLSNVGSEFQRSGQPAEALRYFCMYLEKDPTGSNVDYATAQARAMQIELGNKDVDEGDVCAPPRGEARREPRSREPPEPDPAKPAREVRPDEPELPTEPEPAQGGHAVRRAGLITGGAGLVALGVGAIAGFRASVISDEISSHDRDEPWRDDIRDLERRGQIYENVQVGALITGGVLVATGVILYAVSRSSTPAERTSSRPSERSRNRARDRAVTLAPTTNGVVVLGRF